MRKGNVHKCCQIDQVEINKQMGILPLFYLFFQLVFVLFFHLKKVISLRVKYMLVSLTNALSSSAAVHKDTLGRGLLGDYVTNRP